MKDFRSPPWFGFLLGSVWRWSGLVAGITTWRQIELDIKLWPTSTDKADSTSYGGYPPSSARSFSWCSVFDCSLLCCGVQHQEERRCTASWTDWGESDYLMPLRTNSIFAMCIFYCLLHSMTFIILGYFYLFIYLSIFFQIKYTVSTNSKLITTMSIIKYLPFISLFIWVATMMQRLASHEGGCGFESRSNLKPFCSY